jgi:hypothetical protein
LNAQDFVKRQEERIQRIAIEENNNKKKYDSVLPIEFVEEFESRFLRSRDAETRKGRRKTSHARSKWNAAKKMIVALNIDPSEWYYYNKEIYDYFHEQQLEEFMKGERIICTEAVDQDQAKVLSFIKSLGFSIYEELNSKEQAANLFQENSWLKDVGDQIVFIPSHSLSFLPDYYNYKLLYVQSELDLSPKNQKGESMSTVLSTKKWMHFEQEQAKIEAWMESQANLSILYLNCEEMIQNKEEQGFILDNFLKK